MGLPEVPSVEEVISSMRMPRSKFRENAEYMLAESDVFERALKSDVYRQLWGEKKYPADIDTLFQMPVLTSAFYTRYPERDPRIPVGPVKEGSDAWLCSTGSKRMKFYPFSDYDAKRLGIYGARSHAIAGMSPGDTLINCGAEPPHCSLAMSQWMAQTYGENSVPVVRGMKPEAVMQELLKNAENVVGMIGVPLISLRFLNTVTEKAGRPLKQLFPKFKSAILGGEALNEQQRASFRKLGIEGYGIYASAELCVPAAGCSNNKGSHLFCDTNVYYLKTDEGVKPIWACDNGDIGELFVTTPNREAFPLVNFSTNDVIEVLDKECPCGITHPRINVISRTDDVLNVGGAKAYEQHIEEKFEDVGRDHVIPDWQIHWSKDNDSGFHRFDILIDNDSLDVDVIKEALLKSLSNDNRTEQLYQAQEAGILGVEVHALPHKSFGEKVVTAQHKRVRIVKKF